MSTPLPITQLRTKLFADGAELAGMLEMYREPHIQGFTTNPTLMRKAGIVDYQAFAQQVLAAIPDRPISFEVFADDVEGMERQARLIASWGSNVYVKIPVTNSLGASTHALIERLAQSGVRVNVTALLTVQQVREVSDALGDRTPSYISVFGGRIADTGRDPIPIMRESVELMAERPNQELIWASPRELLNLYQANAIGCHIITVTSDILRKLTLIGKSLETYSLETVQMFYRDAVAAGYRL